MQTMQRAEATLKIRTEPVCRDCYCRFISTKTVKRLEALDRETRSSHRPTKRKYLVGLSFGPSSSALINICDDNLSNQVAKKRSEPFSLHAVHIDTDLGQADASQASHASRVLDRCRARYPRFSFQSVPLASALGLGSIDWSALPPLDPQRPPRDRLSALLAALPSPSSRADVLRLLVRHLLVALAAQHACDALLLGHSTTALAALALAETAKGRGFSLPRQINDGQLPVPVPLPLPLPGSSEPARVEGEEGEEGPSAGPEAPRAASVALYYPRARLFRRELVTYGTLFTPPLTDAAAHGGDGSRRAVVSHRDLSIEEVVTRYFEDVEENYPSVVANVVRTAGKLDRLQDGPCCGVCGMGLDEQGDERWRGEMGENGAGSVRAATAGQLCYGCKRSIRG